MTIVTTGSDEVIDQITKQLDKLVDVVKLQDISSNGEHLERELMLIKVKADTSEKREELKRQADIFEGRILDVTDTTYVIELTGEGSKLDHFIKAMNDDDILETVRSGATGITRGESHLSI